MILTGGDISKITPAVVKKVEEVEKLENHTARVSLQAINPRIFMCYIEFKSNHNNAIAFTSLSIYEKGSRDLLSNYDDGKVSGFEITKFWVDAYREFPECPEHLASEVLFDLFVKGWD